jgi:hypothetical protein
MVSEHDDSSMAHNPDQKQLKLSGPGWQTIH